MSRRVVATVLMVLTLASAVLSSLGCDGGTGRGGAAGPRPGPDYVPVRVSFSQNTAAAAPAGSPGSPGSPGSRGSRGSLALADVSGRRDFGGTLAVTSYAVSAYCTIGNYELRGGAMLVRSGETGCTSSLKKITVADQHGLIATFVAAYPEAGASLDVPGPAFKYLSYAGADPHASMRLELSGAVSTDGRDLSYTFRITSMAAGQSSTGTQSDYVGVESSVSVAGVPLPDVDPASAAAWAAVDAADNETYHARVTAAAASPCGTGAAYSTELYAQLLGTPGSSGSPATPASPDTAERVAAGLPEVLTSGSPYQLTSDAQSSLVSSCRGMSTNIYLKISCTDRTSHLGTSYKIIALKTHIPSSPYHPQSTDGTPYRCLSPAVVGFNWALDLPPLTSAADFLARGPSLSRDAANPNQINIEAAGTAGTAGAAALRYTTDGVTTPDCAGTGSVGTSVVITGDTTVKAIACPIDSGGSPSAPATAVSTESFTLQAI